MKFSFIAESQMAAHWVWANLAGAGCLVAVVVLLALAKYASGYDETDVAYVMCGLAAFGAAVFYSVARNDILSKHALVVAGVTLFQFHFFADEIGVRKGYEIFPAAALLAVVVLESLFIRVPWRPVAPAAHLTPPRTSRMLLSLASSASFKETYHICANALLLGWVLLPIRTVGVLNMDWSFVGILAPLWITISIRERRKRLAFFTHHNFYLADEVSKCAVLLFLPHHAYLLIAILVLFDIVKPPIASKNLGV